jgi:hypothetical protein
MYASVTEVSRSSPIRERKLLFSNFKTEKETEKDLSAVAVESTLEKLKKTFQQLL